MWLCKCTYLQPLSTPGLYLVKPIPENAENYAGSEEVERKGR